MAYRAPLDEIRFILDRIVPLRRIAATPRFAEATEDLTEAVLVGAARLCDETITPLQRSGDRHPAVLHDGVVRTSPGFREAFHRIAEGGWVAVSAPVEYGGMGLPLSMTTAVNDMMSGACLALHLNPLLTQGQIEALYHHASDDLRALYLPKLISGQWSGTMNLTEPQAGSDVGALVTKAEPLGNGRYAVTGQKIFITWADGDLTENTCHLVLARLPAGGAGTKGISLFIVPKFLPAEDGSPGTRNAVRIVSLEHKLGLHGSPTGVVAYEGATGWLVGEPHRGMAAMFTMMNNARLAVGVQGVGAAEAAWQQALHYAAGRDQSGPIIDHPDVRRMLLTMKSEIFAARCIAFACAAATDMANALALDEWGVRAAFLTPIVKAYGSEVGCRVADLGVQIHGGMGYVEESGAAQILRDVRVTSIYEGTNGIQAIDLVSRKLADGGAAAFRMLDEVEATAGAAHVLLPELAKPVAVAASALREATTVLLAQSMPDRCAGASVYLDAFAHVLGAHFHLLAAEAEGGAGPRRKLAAFYIRRLLPEHCARLAQVSLGAADLLDMTHQDLGL